MLIEIHMLKNYPPTNLNRDDTGAPKTCLFGGVTRGRVSSQCLKRSWRTSELFRQQVGEENLGTRTRKLPSLVADRLRELGVAEEAVAEVMPKISGFGNKEGKENAKDNSKTAQVIFYAPQDIEAVALSVKEKIDACESLKEVKKLKAKELQDAVENAQIRPVTLDIALFGRMVTSDAFRDVEASMQVAHAISTHKTAVESDYFTAMDDLLSGETEDEKGSGMIGDVDYNSSCYYIYASLDTDALRKNLEYAEDPDGIIRKAVPALLRTMAFTNPSGKQNTFAGHVLPSAVMVECKEQKVPVSLVNAFAKPVSGRDVVADSIRALVDESDMIARNYGLPVEKRLWFCVDKYEQAAPNAAEVCAAFGDLVEKTAAALQ